MCYGKLIVAVLGDKTVVPFAVLADDVVPPVEEGHGGYEHDDCPEEHRGYELALVLGEKEEGEADDAVELDEGAEHDEEGCPEVFLFLYQTECQQEGGTGDDVELLHEEGVEHLVGTKPQDEQLLVFREGRLADGPIEEQRQCQAPQQQSEPVGADGEGGKEQGEERSVMVAVFILGWVQHIQIPTANGIPKGAAIDEIVVAMV